MHINIILSAFFTLCGCWQAHVAGAGYAIATKENRSDRNAKIRSLTSVILLALAIYFATLDTGSRLSPG
ncbi:MAG TPA: hypothetical protein VNH64_06760 [Parvularculaceae bacterium]|nr:hypothetical protein [Parvularculaceae bacterium]